MDQPPLIRIGSGVPPKPAAPPPRRWFGIKPEFVIAAAVIIAMCLAIAAVYVGPMITAIGAPASAPSRPVEVQVECANITHAYTIWHRGLEELKVLPYRNSAEHQLNQLKGEGAEFLRASRGHKDQASKELAVRVAQYNYELSVIALEWQVQRYFDDESYLKVVEAWTAVEDSYAAFLSQTCS